MLCIMYIQYGVVVSVISLAKLHATSKYSLHPTNLTGKVSRQIMCTMPLLDSVLLSHSTDYTV